MATTRLQIATRIAIEGEAEYNKSIKNINSSNAVLKSELAKLDAEYGKNKNSMEALTSKGKVYAEQIKLQEQKIAETKEQLEKAAAAYGENSTQVEKYQTKLNKLETELIKTKSALDETQNKAKLVGEAMQTSGEKVEKFGGKIESTGKKLSIASAGITGIGTSAVKMSMEFDDSLAQVNTIMDKTVKSTSVMKSEILNLSNETGIAASDTATAVYDAISAGVDTASAVQFVSDANKLAVGGFTDVAGATDILTTALNAYGLEASAAGHVSDVLIATQNIGKTTVDNLAKTMGRAIPSAKSLNVSIEQLGTSYAMLTKNGINTENSTTYLTAMLDELGKTGSKSDKALREIAGVGFAELSAQGYSVADCLALVQKEAEKNDLTLADLFSSTTASKAALTLLKDGVDEYNSVLNAMNNSNGITNENFETMQTDSKKLEIATNKLKNEMISFGEKLTPAVEMATDAVTELSEWFGNLSDEQKETVIKIAGTVAAVGPLVTIFGKMTTGVGKAVENGGKFLKWMDKIKSSSGTSAGAVGKITSALTGSSGLVAGLGIVGSAVGITVGIIQAAEEDMEETAEALGGIADSMQAFQDGVSSAEGVLADFNAETLITDEQIQSIEDGVASCKDRIQQIAENAAAETRALTDAEWEEIQRLVGLIDEYTDKKLEAYNQQQMVVQAMIDRETTMTTENAQNYVKSAEDSYNQVVNLAKAHHSEMYAEAVKMQEEGLITQAQYEEKLKAADDYYSQQEEKARSFYANSLSTIQDAYFAQNVANDELYTALLDHNERIEELNKRAVEESTTMAQGTLAESEGAQQRYNMIMGQIREENAKFSKEVKDMDTTYLGAWVSMAATTEMYGGELSDETDEAAAAVMDSFENLPKKIKETFRDFMDGALDGLRSKAEDLYNKASEIGSTIIGKFRTVFDSHSPSRKMIRFFRDDVMGGGQIGMQQGGESLVEEAEKQSAATIAAIQRAAKGSQSVNPAHYGSIISNDNAMMASLFSQPILQVSSAGATAGPAGGETIEVFVNIKELNNNRNQDIDALGQQIGQAIQNARRAVGKK